MEQFLNQLINGIQIGTLYALIALGYTMVYGIIKLINFAHGDLVMVGAYAAFFCIVTFHLPFPVAFLVAMLLCSGLAVLMDRVAYKPLRNRPRLEALITAMGISLFLEHGTRTLPFVGPNYRRFPEVIATQSYTIIPGVRVTNIQLLNVAIAILLMILLNYLIRRTRIGMAMRAVSQDREAARLMGIDVDRVISVTFAVGGALAGAAGVLTAVAYPRLNPYMGIMPGLKAFVAAVFGGIGSVPGAMVGGLLMGIVETFATATYSQMAEGAFFVILIAVLVFRPGGLMGMATREKV